MKHSLSLLRIQLIVLLILSAHYVAAQPLSWATYFGGTGNDIGSCVATDPGGNVYLSGTTSSASGIATAGAYQTTLAGSGFNAFLSKFNSAGTLSWATYYGGGAENGLAVATDASGNVYIMGVTSSATGIATPGAYQTTLAGMNDAFLAKFSSSGSLLWATYFGGPGNEDYYSSGKHVCVDASGNVYITGNTRSASGIATPGAFMTTYTGTSTNGNAYLAKFTSSGSLLWATYYGGTGGDFANSVATDGSGNVFLSGYTFSATGIATPGAYMAAFAGTGGSIAANAFLVKFNSSGARLWGTYYGGTGGDAAQNLAIDGAGDLYLSGGTGSTSGIVTPGAHLTTLLGISVGFLAKFSNSGSLLWGTYYGGGAAQIQGRAVVSDALGNVYFGGTAGAGDSDIATPGTFLTSAPLGGSFLAKFTSTGSLLWGTYFHGTGGGLTVINGLATDASSNVYFGGFTSDSAGITTAGSYQPIFGGGGHDGLLGVFHDTVTTTTGPAPITGTLTLCVGATTTLHDVTTGGTWSNGATGIATVNTSGTVTGVAAGTTTISYTTSGGTTTTIVTVSAAPAIPTISGAAAVCVGQTITLTSGTSGGVWTSLHTGIATVGSSSGIVTNACGSDSAKHAVAAITGGSCPTKVKHGKRETPPYDTDELSVYPNPNKGTFTLILQTEDDEPVKVIITNIMGQKVREFVATTNQPVTVSLAEHAPGIYFMAARTASQSYFMNVVIE